MKTRQIQDLIDIEGSSLTIKNIEIIIRDQKRFDLFKQKFGDELYSIMLRTITHENYNESIAKHLFEEILIHLEKLNTQLKRDVGIVVAAIDYLSNIKNIMDEPKIIEEEKSEFMTDTSTKDELTGLYLRDIFDVFLNKLIEEAKRENQNLSLIMIDIDDFKKVNDTYGHQKGDEVLSKIGDILNQSIREMDFAARYGGEELCIIMPNTSSSDAYSVADKIRESVSNQKFGELNVTVSIGISALNVDIACSEKLIKYADEALYRAKNSGKNQVVKSQL